MKTPRAKLESPLIKEYRAIVLREEPLPFDRTLLDTPENVFSFYQAQVPDSPRFTPSVENFGVVLVNTRRRLVGWQIISTGTLDTLLVHAREVFRLAILCNAAAVVAFHNHPSGDPTPSEADIKVTRDLIRAGQLLKIDLLDHLIVGAPTYERPKAWSSLRELGYFAV